MGSSSYWKRQSERKTIDDRRIGAWGKESLPALMLDPEDWDSTILRNVGRYLPANSVMYNKKSRIFMRAALRRPATPLKG